MLVCDHISLGYNGIPILSDVHFSLESGQHLLIIGPSGCGKTSLLSILTGLQKPDAGSVRYDDVHLSSLNAQEIDHFRGNHLGIIFQNFHLIKVMSVEQNLRVALRFSGHRADESRIREMLERLGLAQKAHQSAAHLSVGEAQRLAIARAVIGNPKWIFCDEPTSALDDENTAHTLQLLQQEAARCRASLILVTHDARVKSHFSEHQTLMLKAEVHS